MKRAYLFVLCSLTALASLAGCTNINDPGCSTDDQCRGDRVCSDFGFCVDPDRAVIDQDSGNPDVGTDAEDDSEEPGTDPIQIRSARVYDECDGDQHITRISLAPDPFPACDGVLPARVDINIEGALDLNSQTPGQVVFEPGDSSGIRVLGCEGAFCVNATEGQVTLEFYEPGEVLDGSYDFQMETSSEVSDDISGQRFEGTFENLDVNWCSFADDECR
ncbi:MAG: hypothetical protein ACQEVA_17640 [Myxococcota bacterium]